MLTALLLAPLIAAAVIDLRTRRIPNWLTLPAISVALLVGFLDGHFVSAATGALAGGGVATVFAVAARGAFGMGDVKLLAYAGAAVGLGRVAPLMLATALAGGVLALVFLAVHRRGDVTMPYGPAIACGSAVALLVA